jgi:hypothetical protein
MLVGVAEIRTIFIGRFEVDPLRLLAVRQALLVLESIHLGLKQEHSVAPSGRVTGRRPSWSQNPSITLLGQEVRGYQTGAVGRTLCLG